ncbi:MAG: DUF5723 family protein [Bacteroidales bacterium]|jgi:hypothetical protein|nr:DUF5723 family protein [Bacteroidales bacterium]
MKQFRYLSIIVFVALAHSAHAQIDNSMFFMDRLPQANLINPAQEPQVGWFLSGAMLPVVGQVPPPLTIAVNTPLSWHDVIFRGRGMYRDSLISFMHPSYNVENFTNKLHKNNFFVTNFDVNLLYFGFRQKENYWTFDITTRVNSFINIPGDLLKFAILGNGAMRRADISGLSVNATVYNQIGVGFERKLPMDFTMGVRAKFLMGAANVSNAKGNVTIRTEENTNALSVMANYEVRTNLPLEVSYTDNGNVDLGNIKFGKMSISGNSGAAIDLGVSKKINEQISVYASMIDFGFIHWRRNVNRIALRGEGLTFEGAEISLNPFKLEFPDFDSLFNTFSIDHSEDSYITTLPFQIYVGGHYQFTEIVGAGLLAHLQKRPLGIAPAFTASLDVRPFKFGIASFTYSYMNRNFTNMGLAYTLRVGPVQWYFVSDNVLGNLLFPARTRSVSARFGCNVVFNRNDGENYSQKRVKHTARM